MLPLRFLLYLIGSVIFSSLCAHGRYFERRRHNPSWRRREARLAARTGGGGGYGDEGGGDYGQTDTYNGGSTGSGYVPQQIPTQGGFVGGQGAYYGASAPFIDYRHTHINIPLPEIEIPRFHLPTLPGGPPPLFLPTIDIPGIPYPNIELPRIPPIHPPQVNFPAIPPVEGIDIPYPWVRFVKEDWPNGGNVGGPYGGSGGGVVGYNSGGGGGGLYKRTGRKSDINITSSSRGGASSLGARSGEAESREVPIEIPVKRTEIRIKSNNNNKNRRQRN